MASNLCTLASRNLLALFVSVNEEGVRGVLEAREDDVEWSGDGGREGMVSCVLVFLAFFSWAEEGVSICLGCATGDE